MKKIRGFSKTIFLSVLLLFTLNIIHAGYNEISWILSPKSSSDFAENLGYLGLSIPSECLSSRNPILEPICLSDIPGGYCYHESCAKVAPIFLGKNYSIEVIHP